MSGFAISNRMWDSNNSPDASMMEGKFATLLGAFSSTSATTAIEQPSIYNELQSLASKNNLTIFDAPFSLAYRFIKGLPANSRNPDVDFDEDGDVTLDWISAKRKMMVVSISKTGGLSYACRISDTDKQHGTKIFIDSVPQDILDCLKKVV
jgi:hypothetical protein